MQRGASGTVGDLVAQALASGTTAAILEAVATLPPATLRRFASPTADGLTGAIYGERLETLTAPATAELELLLSWADAICASAKAPVTIGANIDNDDGARLAKSAGATDIGLYRTEHLFSKRGRIRLLRQFLLADSPKEELVALEGLELAQAGDFVAVLDAAGTLPVTIRLLDAPLHEFVPDLVERIGLPETNPMLGTRGLRLAIVRPGIYQMQVRALARALATLIERGGRPRVEIMVPMVAEAKEVALVRGWITEVLTTASLQFELPVEMVEDIKIGTMIETPRAALTTTELCQHVDFFSFGTNDLTQSTFGLNRDHSEATLIPAYQSLGLFADNPFVRLDPDGVGRLIEIACQQARRTKPSVSLRACGTHVGDPVSIARLIALGVTSLSVAPCDLAVARLAAAQALLQADASTIDAQRLDNQTLERHLAAVKTPRTSPPNQASPVDEAAVLHALRLRGYVTFEGLQASLGAVPKDLLDRLQDDGLVRFIAGRDLFALSPAGRAQHQTHLNNGILGAQRDFRPEISSALWLRLRSLVAEAHLVFADWQFRSGANNDHTDAGYDQSIVIRTEHLAEQAAAIIDSVMTVMPRLCRYKQRLYDAASAVGDGHDSRLTGQMCESFQEVWTELLDDLELTAGFDRTS